DSTPLIPRYVGSPCARLSRWAKSLCVCNAYYACMTEVTVSARIPQELEKEVERLMGEEHLEKSAALRKLLHLGVQNYRLERAIRGLGERRFSLLKAAEEAGLTIWEVLERRWASASRPTRACRGATGIAWSSPRSGPHV